MAVGKTTPARWDPPETVGCTAIQKVEPRRDCGTPRKSRWGKRGTAGGALSVPGALVDGPAWRDLARTQFVMPRKQVAACPGGGSPWDYSSRAAPPEPGRWPLSTHRTNSFDVPCARSRSEPQPRLNTTSW